MATNLFIRRSLSRYSLLIVSLLTLVGILSGCGASSTAVTSHPTGSTPTSTPTKEFKGTISEFPLPTPNFYPGGLLAGPDGNLWFPETVRQRCQSGKIGRITPEGKVSEFLLSSDSEAGGITTGPDSNLWFIESACAKSQNSKIGRITVSGTISEFSLSSNSNPSEITTGRDHALWFTEFGNNIQNDKIGRITTSGTISEFPLPTPHFYPYGITAGQTRTCGLSNLMPTTRTSRSGASPPQARSVSSPYLLLSLNCPVLRPGRTATSGLSHLITASLGA